ncbi:MAG: hypothetical protein EAZ15_04595 [Sphingobacteriales bacterium]|nr:MAG: hypothetical protein EAZ15_04595 [Sphingobacteriales bacterium]
MRIFFRQCKLILIAFITQITNIYAECDYITDPFCEDTDLPLDTNLFILIVFAAIFSFFMLLKNNKQQIASETLCI